jgi:hypothetical protein
MLRVEAWQMALKQTSIWLEEDDIKALKRIGKRPDVDREWSYLARKAMREFIERDEKQHGKDKS